MAIVRVGVLGGTFNPIHFGHLRIAESIRELFSLSRVYFVVATTPPHKLRESIIDFTHRYAMVSIAVADRPCFIPSAIELEPQASPFSVDTMRKLASSTGQPPEDMYFIAGGDSLAEVKSWRESETLLTSYNFIFAARPGVKPADCREVLPGNAVGLVRDITGLGKVQARRRIADKPRGETRIYIADVGAPDISATRIRALASAGKPVRRMVPARVCDYISKLNLYGE